MINQIFNHLKTMMKWKFNMKHHKQVRKVKRNKIQKKAKYKIMNNNFYNLLQKI